MINEIITIPIDDAETYYSIKSAIIRNDDKMYFKFGDDILCVDIVQKSDNDNTDNAKNVVIEWLEDIKEIAENAYIGAGASSKEQFQAIFSYCSACITTLECTKNKGE